VRARSVGWSCPGRVDTQIRVNTLGRRELVRLHRRTAPGLSDPDAVWYPGHLAERVLCVAASTERSGVGERAPQGLTGILSQVFTRMGQARRSHCTRRLRGCQMEQTEQ